jgi:hypothetical protein
MSYFSLFFMNGAEKYLAGVTNSAPITFPTRTAKTNQQQGFQRFCHFRPPPPEKKIIIVSHRASIILLTFICAGYNTPCFLFLEHKFSPIMTASWQVQSKKNSSL